MKTPAFQLYPGDFLSSPDVQMMTTVEVGAYCLLLFNAWIITDRPGYLPNNERKLQRLSKLSDKDWKRVKDVLLEKFIVTEDGKFLFNKRLATEYTKQEARRLRLAENGKKGGRPPKNEDIPEKPKDNLQVISEEPTLEPEAKQGERLSISSSISSSKEDSVVPQKPPKPLTLHQSAIAAFNLEYRSKFDTDYIFQAGKDGKAISTILANLKKKITESGRGVTDELVMRGFIFFIGSVRDKWILDNFSPSTLASKFNEIYVKSKTPKPQPREKPKEKTVEETLGLFGDLKRN